MRQREGAAPLETEARPSAPAKDATSHGTTATRPVNSSRRAGPLARCAVILAAILTPWAVIIGLWQLVEHVPAATPILFTLAAVFVVVALFREWWR